MSLWVDKYRPLTLDKVDYHKDQAAQLTRLAASGDLPHLLFYGPSGAGKKTRVMALLRAIFGAGVEKVRRGARAAAGAAARGCASPPPPRRGRAGQARTPHV